MTPKPVIEKASELGFCCGVRRAVSLLEKESGRYSLIETLGPVVHNDQVVKRLENLGIRNADTLANIRGNVVAITAHGTDPGNYGELKNRRLKVIDTTCAIVRAAQKAVARLARSGYGVVVFGDPNHPEVKGLLGWSGDKALATTSAADVQRWANLPARLGIVSQTTNTLDSFRAFLNAVVDGTLPPVRELHVVDTTCRVTRTRQQIVRELALRSDLLIVVGGKNSANTRRLAETSAAITKTYAVESAGEIMARWLQGKNHIGIVAGTSTPDDVVTSVETRLKELAG